MRRTLTWFALSGLALTGAISGCGHDTADGGQPADLSGAGSDRGVDSGLDLAKAGDLGATASDGSAVDLATPQDLAGVDLANPPDLVMTLARKFGPSGLPFPHHTDKNPDPAEADKSVDGIPDDIANVKAKPCINGKAQEFYGFDDECVLFTTNTNWRRWTSR